MFDFNASFFAFPHGGATGKFLTKYKGNGHSLFGKHPLCGKSSREYPSPVPGLQILVHKLRDALRANDSRDVFFQIHHGDMPVSTDRHHG